MDRQAVQIRVRSVDRVEKYNLGRTPDDGAPDEVIELEGEDRLASEAYPEIAEGIKRVERRETFKKLLGVALSVGLALATGIHALAAPVFMGGLTTAGATLVAQQMLSSCSYLGVGDGSTAFAIGQTDLQGTNKQRVVCDASYPQQSANVITCQATFSTSVANFVAGWLENGVFTAVSSGTMIVRKVVNLGVKVSGATWVFTKTLTFTTG